MANCRPASQTIRPAPWRVVAWLSAVCLFPVTPVTPVTAADAADAPSLTHWAFAPIRRPELPGTRDPRRAGSQIDRLIAARLAAAGLAPSPPADARTLVRRACYDLTGLPPTAKDLRALEQGERDLAFAGLIDRLLARREYGQRWARHWLDVARYADTTGYQESSQPRYPFAWTYRDYVIRSFNQDTPFDRFIVEQLAADQLELADEQRWKLAALGFLTTGPRFNYNRHEEIDDRIDVVTRGLLGLGVACARCHDHKYDPVLMDDYYGLYGVFASSREPSYARLPQIGQSRGKFARYRKFREVIRKRRRSLELLTSRTHRKVQHEMRAFAADYLRYLVQKMPGHRTRTQVSLDTRRTHLRGPTPYGPGGIIRWQHYVTSRGNLDAVFGPWNRLAVFTKEEFVSQVPVVLAGCKNLNRLVREAWEAKPPRSMLELAGLYGGLLEETYARWRELQRRDPQAGAFPDAAREQLRAVLFADDAPPVMVAEAARDLYTDGEFNDFMRRKQRLDSAFLEYADVAAPRAMVLVDRDTPLEPRVFERGNANRPGRSVPRRFLRVLESVDGGRPFSVGSGRAELARAIVSPDNPLTARVIANRVWQWHFGKGLVDTPSDFGTRGSRPTHPRLLDFLAATLVENDWSLKHLHRTIMASATYQQSSRGRADGDEADPGNRLMWRMSRRRLGWESLRDSLLEVSGRLDTRLGGRPATKLTSRRRSVYLLTNRQGPLGVPATFDAPSPDISSSGRAETTVPQQALFLLNSGFVLGTVERLVDRMRAVEPDMANHEHRLAWLYRQVLKRSPTRAEQKLAVAHLADARNERTGESFEAWHVYVQVLLLSNEFLFID